MAKTQYSFSHDAKLRGDPSGERMRDRILKELGLISDPQDSLSRSEKCACRRVPAFSFQLSGCVSFRGVGEGIIDIFNGRTCKPCLTLVSLPDFGKAIFRKTALSQAFFVAF